MNRPPEFDQLVGSDLPPEERERLRRVHDLLVAAGPPPELPPALASAPAPPGATVRWLPSRRRGALLVLAAALAAAMFGVGYLVGDRNNGFQTEKTIPMHGTAAAPTARASLALAPLDAAGNWPMKMTIRGLGRLPRGGFYELFLTRNHRPAATCGTFRVEGTTTTVYLNAPYDLRKFDGWVVTRHLPGSHRQPVLLTT